MSRGDRPSHDRSQPREAGRPGLLFRVARVTAVVGAITLAAWWIARTPAQEAAPPTAPAEQPPGATERATQVEPRADAPEPVAQSATRGASPRPDTRPAAEAADPLKPAERAAQQARAAERRGDRKAALQAIERALALEPEHAGYLREAGRLSRDLGQLEEAEAYLLRALAVEEHATGLYSTSVAETLGQLGGIYLAQRRYEEAEAAYLRELDIQQGSPPGIAAAQARLGLLYRIQGRPDEALIALEAAVYAQEEASGIGDVHVASRLADLGDFHRSQGLYDESEAAWEQSLAILEAAHGLDDVRNATALTGLALLYEDQERYAEAEPLLLRSLTLHENAYGNQHPLVLYDLARLSSLHLSQGSYEEAEPYYTRVLALDDSAPVGEQPRVGIVIGQLAQALTAQENQAEAEALYQWGIAMAMERLGPDSESALYLKQQYADYLNRNGQQAVRPTDGD